MRSSFTIVPMLINIFVILFVFKAVAKFMKKNQKSKQGDDRNHREKPSEHETTINMTPLEAKDLKHEKTTENTASLSLKRCPNCGGEIPLTMMKCDICGHRQPGCGVAIIVILLVLGVIALFISANFSGVQVREYISLFFQWLANL